MIQKHLLIIAVSVMTFIYEKQLQTSTLLLITRIILFLSSKIDYGLNFSYDFSRNPNENSTTVSNHVILMENQRHPFPSIIELLRL